MIVYKLVSTLINTNNKMEFKKEFLDISFNYDIHYEQRKEFKLYSYIDSNLVGFANDSKNT